MSIRVILADDHLIFREALRGLLAGTPDIRVVADAPDGRAVIEALARHGADVLVLDICMPGLNGIDVARSVAGSGLPTKIVALSMHSETHLIDEMLRAGALAYVPKDAGADELCRAIRAAAVGQMFLGERIAAAIVQDYVRHHPSPDRPSATRLTPREREVLQAMAEGLNTKQIAQCLHVSTKTIETHRRQVMEKLQINNVAHLTKYAIREGITPLDA